AYGWSAGAHLAASAAIFTGKTDSNKEVSCIPNALILVSPALSLSNDGWVKRILLDRVPVKSISPAEHVRKNMPPTIILIGREDTVTPLEGTQRFCLAMEEKGNKVELHIFDNVGHLFTPAGEPDDRWPNPDKEVQARAYKKADEFLEMHGFIKKQ
ncbi:MAG: prolyl oligopeptidase family serine peptidase, partial [Calditrichia bacterium]